MTDTPDATPVTPPPHVQPYTGRECSYMAVGACNKCGWCDPTVTDTPDATPAEATSHLYGDTDAMRWTDAFASLFKVTRRSDGQDMDTDGLMLGWFANAIETGRDAGAARATAAERERILGDDSDDPAASVYRLGIRHGKNAERCRIRQLAIDKDVRYLEPCDQADMHDGNLHTHHRRPFADLLGGTSHSTERPHRPFELEPDTEATMIRNGTHPTIRHPLGQPSAPVIGQCECWLHYTTTQLAENDEKHTCTECGDEW